MKSTLLGVYVRYITQKNEQQQMWHYKDYIYITYSTRVLLKQVHTTEDGWFFHIYYRNCVTWDLWNGSKDELASADKVCQDHLSTLCAAVLQKQGAKGLGQHWNVRTVLARMFQNLQRQGAWEVYVRLDSRPANAHEEKSIFYEYC